MKLAWKEWEEKDKREAQQRAQPAGYPPVAPCLRVVENGAETLVLALLHMHSPFIHACTYACAPSRTRVRAPTSAFMVCNHAIQVSLCAAESSSLR